MSSFDRITPLQLIKRSPNVIKRIPAIIQGMIAAKQKKEFESVGLLVERTVNKYPLRTAIYYEDRTLNYTEFNQAANKVAHYLKESGFKKGNVVALFMHNRPEFLICLLAVAKLGGTTALLNTAQTGKVLAHSINLVSPRLIIAGQELTQPIDDIRAQLSIKEEFFFCAADGDVRSNPSLSVPDQYVNIFANSQNSPTDNLPDTALVSRYDHFCYIYTSGTTGMPKAVITKHDRFCWASNLIKVFVQLEKEDIYYVPLPLFHATALLASWNSVIASGAAIVIKRKFSASEFWNDINKYQATIFGYVGELCRYLLNQPPKASDGRHTLKKMFGNGLRPGNWMEFKNRFQVPTIIEGYGSSEGNIGFANLFNMDCTIGMGNATLVEYDKEKDEIVRDSAGHMIKAKQGEAGLLIGQITDKSPFSGYTQKDKTEAVILRDVFKPGDAWFNTGDLLRNIGCWHFQFVDRLGDTFRWKGENVSTTEVENTLITHPDIAHCTVYGVEIPDTNGRAGMATITPQPNTEVNYKELFEFLSKSLPPYAVPLFIRVKQKLDTTDTFKYKKVELKTQAYDVKKCNEPLYVALPKSGQYTPMNEDLQMEIDGGNYRF